MVEMVTSIPLPVMEDLQIKRNRYEGGTEEKKKRISIVTGIHGDELEGQYVCFELGRRIQEHPEYLNGIVDVYPAINPLGIDSITRGVPGFDIDLNRLFPGNEDGTMTEYLAAQVIRAIVGSDLVLDIHASNIFLTEVPQVRINTLHKEWLVPIASKLNVDFIWVHANSTVLESTFAFSLNSRNTPTLVVEMGVGMRLTETYCMQLTDGIFNVMHEMGIWSGPVGPVRRPMISTEDDDVSFLNAPMAGVFVQKAHHGDMLEEGGLVGLIVDPLEGKVLSEVTAPQTGLLFTIREHPVVNEGSLVGRILKKEAALTGDMAREQCAEAQDPEGRRRS